MTTPGEADDGLVEVHLLGVPFDIRKQVVDRSDDVRRELQLMDFGGDETARTLRRLLGQVWATMPASYQKVAEEMRRTLDDAAAAGADSIDLTYRVPAEVAPAMQRMDALLSEVESMCRSGAMLTLAASDDVLAYGHWISNQFIDQLAGRPPVSWADWHAPRPEGEPGPAAGT